MYTYAYYFFEFNHLFIYFYYFKTQRKEIEFTWDVKGLQIDGQDAMAEIDPIKIDRVIQNLLSNAIKFTPRGGRIELIATVIQSPDLKYFIKVSLKDTGIGIGLVSK